MLAASLALTALLAAAPAAPAGAPPLSPAEVVAKVVAANAKLESWSCHFLERRQFVHFNETETKEGRIRLKRGVGLRVDVEGADSETIVVGRKRAVQWRPRTKQLHIYPLGEDGARRDLSPIPFAFGDASWDPSRDHRLALLEGASPEVALELTPLAESPTYTRKVLFIDPKSWLPVRLQLTESTDDTITFVFSQIEQNPRLEDAIFSLETPADADVVEHKDLPSF